jgi:cell division protein FtsQ
MGRKRNDDDTPMFPGMEDPLPPPAAPGPKTRARTAPVLPRLIAGTLATVVAVFAAIFLLHRTEQFLISDPRFALDDPDNEILIAGAQHANSRAIEAIFAEDSNRSIYLVPVNDRRMTLKTVNWIKDATVARIWPNRLVVQISERKPVAFLTLSAGRVGLIDEDGVVLPQAQDHFTLPVVTGVRASDPLHERRERIARLQRFTKEVGEAGKNISEIDVADHDNLKVRQPYEGRVLTLLLGDNHFLLRYQNFLTHYAEIKRKLPGAATLDLRLEDRITVVE